MSTITVEVYERDGTTPVATALDMAQSFDREWRDPLNDTGEGTVSITADDAMRLVLDYGMVVRMLVDGVDRFQWIIEAREIHETAEGEERDQFVTYSGRGVAALLEDALVWPFGAIPGTSYRKPAPDERMFGVMADEYDHSGWAFATEIADQGTGTAAWQLPDAGGNAPASWPDPTAAWIWDSAADATDAPEGTVYFRALFSVPADGQYAIFAAGDDLFTLYLDAVPLVGVDTEPLQWQTTRRAVVTMTSGFHLIAAVAENLPGTPGANPAGLLVAIYEQDQYGDIGALLTNSNSLWLVLPRPANPPGVTAGTILEKLLSDAQSHGALLDVSWSFDPDLDSDGASWSELPTFTIPIGKSILDVVRMLVDAGHIDFEMDATGLIAHAWIGGTRGSAKTVTLAPGDNLTELTFQGLG